MRYLRSTPLVALWVGLASAFATACAPVQPEGMSEVEAQAIRDTILGLAESADAAVDALDCATGVGAFGDWDPLFVSNGTVIRTRPALSEMCERMVAGRTGALYEVERATVHVLSADAAYLVREGDYTIHYRDRDDRKSTLVITGVWVRGAGGWKRVHFHESSAPR